ncbi:hypothetical protein Patl1_30553 [Pistacia atlantica]|uniref:Uncharacterized protein n=1 Tax=Pistacia atlantica TaxID=434234 RepID=A0ACC1AER4_9ROSI|nr:hypothetical protein Patl1_30553 [Pistacia atlantica]
MANGADSEDKFVVLSKIRTGLKREFEFALKVQSEICGSLGRTRSKKAHDNVDLGHELVSPPLKKLKTYVSRRKRKEEAKGVDVVKDLDKDTEVMSEEEAKSDVVDLVDEVKVESICNVGGVIPKPSGEEELMCEDEIEKEELCKNDGKKAVVYEKEVLVNVEEGKGENNHVEEGKGENQHEEEGKGESHHEEGKNEAEKVVIGVEEEKSNGCDKVLMDVQEDKYEKTGEEKEKEKETENVVVGVEAEKKETENLVVGVEEETKNETENVVDAVIEEKKNETEGGLAENGLVEGKLGEEASKKSGSLCEEGSGAVEPVVVGGNEDVKVTNGVVERPLRRFTRSFLQQKVQSVKTRGGKESGVKEESDHRAASPLFTTPMKQDSPVKSNKVARKFYTKLKAFLESGILEGMPVRYIRGSKVRDPGVMGLQGVIKGSGILCFCGDCNGNEVVTPNVFEMHAGSTNKRPPEYIYLENDKTLRDVMNVCKDSPLETLEETVRMVVGSSRIKSGFCLNCRGSISEVRTEEMLLLCNSCMDLKEPEAVSGGLTETSDGSPEPSSAQKLSYSVMKNSSSSKSQGRVTRKDLRMHKLVFEEGGLLDGTELAYFVRGQKLLVGYKMGAGILCSCCKSEVSPSQFEAHAGWASRRKPFQHIYTSNGVSLHEYSIKLSKERRFSTKENDDLCGICMDGGNLLCCDSCPRAFHKDAYYCYVFLNCESRTLAVNVLIPKFAETAESRTIAIENSNKILDCVSLLGIPKGAWYCRYCLNMFQKEKFVERNANAKAAGRVPGVDPIAQITNRCIRIVETPETELGGCVLCRGRDFCKSKFGHRTVILCDQCEREYHVGCLKDHGMEDLKELPKGKWLCCADCKRINSALQKLVDRGEERLPDTSINVLKKKNVDNTSDCGPDVDVRWRVLRGKKMDASDGTRVLLSKAVSIFHDRFDPIIESQSKLDLIPSMVYGRSHKGQDYHGMYCAILTVNQVVVSAGIFRIFGQELAELPLVATSTECQGQGYFQCLFSCFEKLLGFLNVKTLVLPSASEAQAIWTNKFGFNEMSQDEQNKYRNDYPMMIFQGTSMLEKAVPKCRIVAKSVG